MKIDSTKPGRAIVTCHHCGGDVDMQLSKARAAQIHFCNRDCQNAARRAGTRHPNYGRKRGRRRARPNDGSLADWEKANVAAAYGMIRAEYVERTARRPQHRRDA